MASMLISRAGLVGTYIDQELAMLTAQEPERAAPSADRIGLTDIEIAAALGASVHWVRKDRRAGRLLPFYRIGGMIRYNHQRVLESLARFEEGGAPAALRKGMHA